MEAFARFGLVVGLVAALVAGCAGPARRAAIGNRSLPGAADRDDVPPGVWLTPHARLRRIHSAPTPWTQAALGGVVRDLAGAPIAGATLVATGLDVVPPQSQTTISEEDGSYQFTELPPGRWQLTVFFGELTIEAPPRRLAGRRQVFIDVDVDVAAAVQPTIVID